MSVGSAWVLAAVLGAVFLAANVANLCLMFGKPKDGERAGGSPVMFVGGIAGALAMLAVPIEGAKDYWWVALVVDLGTGPLLALTAVLLTFQALFSPAFLRRVPFMRYLVAKSEEVAREPWPLEQAIVGCILGTAVGDAMGLACEGLSRDRQRRLTGSKVRYRMLFGRGLASDDTEHTCMVAQSMIETSNWANDFVEGKFRGNLGWRLRLWLLMLPAGIGLATLRAILKLWIGFPTRWSGVRSAGNGPAMRVAIIGVACANDTEKARLITRAATRITHTHPDAEQGAVAIMLAARLAATRERDVAPDEYLAELVDLIGGDASMLEPARSACDSAARGESAEAFADSIGCGKGVSGWIRHTVPAVIQIWLTHQSDYRGAVETMVRLGGDSDTTAAIVGAIVGARVGRAGIPKEWLRDLWEWPRSVAWMERLGEALAQNRAQHALGGSLELNLFGLMLRNLLFIPLVLAHGFRRLLPPY